MVLVQEDIQMPGSSSIILCAIVFKGKSPLRFQLKIISLTLFPTLLFYSKFDLFLLKHWHNLNSPRIQFKSKSNSQP